MKFIDMRLNVKIFLLFLLVSLITAGTVGTIALVIGHRTLKTESYNKLTAIRELKAREIENYFEQIFNQVISFSESPTVTEAFSAFSDAFESIDQEQILSTSEVRRMDSVLNAFYEDQFIEKLKYRDTTINYFSLPKSELIQSRNLWLSIRGRDTGEVNGFPALDPAGFTDDLNIEGSSTVSSLANYLLDLFAEAGATGTVTYEGTGTLEGIQGLADGSGADIVGSSRKLGDEEKLLFQQAGLNPLEFRIGTDALVVVVSDRNNQLKNLSSEDLARVFTTATNWSEIDPEWPDQPILRYIPSPGSGSYDVFSRILLNDDQEALLNWPNTRVIEDGRKMREQLAADPWSIAFFSYNYFDHGSSMKVLDIDGVKLDNPAIRNNSYRLRRPLYLVTTESNMRSNDQIALLINYFLNVVDKELGADLQKQEYWPQQLESRILQYSYILNNALPGEGNRDLGMFENGTSYDAAHRLFHPIFSQYKNRFGFYDIFLMDDAGNIVYTVEKEVDFGTNILRGPYRNSGIARVFQKAVQSRQADTSFFEDFSNYQPSFNSPASFISSPVFSGDRMLGVLAVQLPVDRINQIMTDGYEWERVGLGKTGETYLVGEDYLIRNQPRFLIEDPDHYFDMLEKVGTSHHVRAKIKNLNSAIGLHHVVTDGTRAALNGETGTQIFNDYRGVDVFSAYKPLDLKQVKWVIMSEIDKSEAFASISQMFRTFLIWFFIILLVTLALSLYFARSISHPVQVLTAKATELAGGNLEKAVEMNRNDELGILGKSFEKMRISLKNVIGDLQDLNQHLEEKVEERTEELKASNQRITGIINNLADALVIINEKGNILFYSPSAVKLFQYSQDEITGKNIKMLMPSPHSDQHDEYLENYLKTGEAKVVGVERLVHALRKDGTSFPARLMISEVVTGKDRQFVGLIGDLTKIREAEKTMRSQSAAMQAAANGIMITDIHGNIQWVNHAFTELTGYKALEAIGQNPRILNSGQQDKAYYKKMWDTILSGDSWHEEIINKRKDGVLYDEEQTITPIFGEENQITGFVGIKQDITERKEMEAIVLKAKERMEGELNVAKDIQLSMLPLIFPAFPKRKEIDLFAKLIPAREVGGDFYDFYFTDESHFCFVVGDVSGKGVPAALMMAVTKTLMKSRASNDMSTASILTHVNNEIASGNDANMFITVFIGILDTLTGEMVYSNAGHNPTFLIRQSRSSLEKLQARHGPVIGALPDLTYGETKLKLSKNDCIFIYTDGVTEAQDVDSNLFSDARLEAFLKSNLMKNPDELVNGIVNEVILFEKGHEQSDDITVLTIKYLENPLTVSIKQLEVEIANDLEEIVIVQENFEAFAKENGIPGAMVNRFHIVFDEVLNNIISYAYQDRKKHMIKVKIDLLDHQLVITITDDGIPFNAFGKSEPDTSQTVDERPIGGLGIHLIKKMVDRYTYKRDVNNNIMILVKQNIFT